MEPQLKSIGSTYLFANKFKTPQEEKDYKKMTEDELLAELKASPDFAKFVFPNEWYSKYELPTKECMNFKEFLAEAPWMKRFSNNYIGKKDVDALPGGNRPVLPAPEAPQLVVLKNEFSEGSESTNQISDANLPETQ